MKCRSAIAMLTAVGTLALAASAIAATVTVTVTQGSSKTAIHQTKHVTIHRGDKLLIAFKGRWYDSGYSWGLAARPAASILKYVGSKTKQPSTCCGLPETQTHSYQAVGTGTTELHYRLSGPDAKPLDAGDLTVTVKVT